ncbi:hypothetical protein Tco_0222375 [Tanacetum coccineum]
MPVVEKDVGVLRAAVVSYEMNLGHCLVDQEDISDPKNLTYRDTQPSTMEHLVNACAFVSPPLPLSLKADKFVEPAQVTSDIDDYMDIENDPSNYCLDNLSIGIEEDTQNGELTIRLSHDGNMNLDNLIANATKSENKSLLMIKEYEVNVVKGDGKPVLGKVFKVIGRIKKPRIFKQAPYMQQRPTTPQVKKKQMYKFPWVNYGLVVDEHFWLTRGLPLVFGDPLQTTLAYREHMLAYLWKHKVCYYHRKDDNV